MLSKYNLQQISQERDPEKLRQAIAEAESVEKYSYCTKEHLGDGSVNDPVSLEIFNILLSVADSEALSMYSDIVEEIVKEGAFEYVRSLKKFNCVIALGKIFDKCIECDNVEMVAKFLEEDVIDPSVDYKELMFNTTPQCLYTALINDAVGCFMCLVKDERVNPFEDPSLLKNKGVYEHDEIVKVVLDDPRVDFKAILPELFTHKKLDAIKEYLLRENVDLDAYIDDVLENVPVEALVKDTNFVLDVIEAKGKKMGDYAGKFIKNGTHGIDDILENDFEMTEEIADSILEAFEYKIKNYDYVNYPMILVLLNYGLVVNESIKKRLLPVLLDDSSEALECFKYMVLQEGLTADCMFDKDDEDESSSHAYFAKVFTAWRNGEEPAFSSSS